jgi:hypothetical protein
MAAEKRNLHSRLIMPAPKYNIVELATTNVRPAQLLYALWEVLAPATESLLKPEEIVVLKAWEFDSTHGNGVRDQVINEGYTTIVDGLKALRELGDERIGEYVRMIESTFSEFGVGCGSVEDIERLELLSLTERNRLYCRLDEAEESFKDEIWIDEIIVNATRNYIEKNWDVFLSRS